MGSIFRGLCLTVFIVSFPSLALAETWIEFHTEQWSQKSGKQKKKLRYTNRYFYDAASRVTSQSGEVTLWVKEIAYNDTLYVKKSDPESETVYRMVHLWCSAGLYQVLQADTDEGRPNEVLSETIKPGSYYDRLQQAVCN